MQVPRPEGSGGQRSTLSPEYHANTPRHGRQGTPPPGRQYSLATKQTREGHAKTRLQNAHQNTLGTRAKSRG